MDYYRSAAMIDNRPHYNKVLSELKDSLLDLASMVDKAMHISAYILKVHDYHQAEKLILADQKINARRYELEEEALAILSTQQPVMTKDLRLVAAVLHIAGELERMGDYAKGLARISESMATLPPTEIMIKMDRMLQICREMLNRSLDAFIQNDVKLAAEIAQRDDEVDELYNQVYRDLLSLMMTVPGSVDLATPLMWAVHNIERMGDRITNICERIIFVETGRMQDTSPHSHAD